MKLANGYILHHDKDSHVVVIATGITRASANRKTGRMVQVWILRDDMTPVQAVKTGQDAAICGTCPHRGELIEKINRKGRRKLQWLRKRSCYVNVGQAPQAIYRAFRRGSYSFLPFNLFFYAFKAKKIRLGAYGDPAMIPAHIVARLCELASKHTGYTHQWKHAEWLKPFVMASCDTPADFIQASHHSGWRTFRVSTSLEPQPGEILCPASEEAGHRTQCERCGLCNGAGSAKSIFIPVHGSGKKNAFTILQ